MRRIESFEDQMNGVVTYEFEDGSRVCLGEKAVRECGAVTILRDAGYIMARKGLDIPRATERVPVMQGGRQVGTLPGDFDPMFIKSSSWLYEPRSGDFRRDGTVWIAAKQLGPGDLDAVPGFVWNRPANA